MPSRAWIDPITNVIRPRSVLLRRDLRGFVIGPWPAHTIQPFIHELTHHWCFHSAVGLALACLRMRSLRLSANSSKALFDEMLTVNTFLDLVRPISEGLALFAEYDMTPGTSTVVTTPLLWASVALSPRTDLLDLSQSEASDKLTDRLLDLRLSRESLSRKVSFLSRPLTPLDNAYFDGYMIVKRIYLDLSQRVSALEDADLFLSYFRSYLFEDYGMVAILAGEDANPFHRLVAMIERFGARLAELYRQTPTANDVSIFEQFNNRPPNSDRTAGIPGLGLDAKDLENGLKIQERLLSELEDKAEMEPTMRQFLNVHRGWLSRRSLAFVASEPIDVQVLNGVVSAWPDPPDDEFPLITGVSALAGVANSKGRERGWVSLVLQPQSSIFATVVGIGKRTVAVKLPPGIANPESADLDVFSDPLCSPILVEEQAEMIKEWVDGYFGQAPEPIKTWIAQTRQSTLSALTRIGDFFLGRWGEDHETACRCLRSRNRLWDFFSPDRTLFETFVALGVLRNFDVLLPSFSAELAKHGWDSSLALQAALRIQETGVSLVRNDNGVLRWLV